MCKIIPGEEASSEFSYTVSVWRLDNILQPIFRFGRDCS